MKSGQKAGFPAQKECLIDLLARPLCNKLTSKIRPSLVSDRVDYLFNNAMVIESPVESLGDNFVFFS